MTHIKSRPWIVCLGLLGIGSSAARPQQPEAWLKYQDKEVWRAAPATVGIFDRVTSKRYGAFSVKTIAKPVAEK